MHRYLDSQLKTKFDVPEKTIVFTTSKTLNERFTGRQTRRVFVLNNGYTALYEDNCVKRRVAFQNRRSVDFHKRFSLYQRGDFKAIEKKFSGNEDQNLLKLRLAEIGNRRRTVLKRRKLSDEELTKFYPEEFEKSTDPSSDCYNINSSSEYIDVSTRRNSRSSNLTKTRENDDKFCKKSFSFDRGPVKRTWDGRPKSKDLTADDSLKDSEGSEPIVYSPSPSCRKNNHSRHSLYKWRRGPPTKEELDEDLDRYMAEAKLKTTPTTPVEEDVDSFVMEYMLETEKCVNENADIIAE